MEKLVLIPYDKYQRLTEAHSRGKESRTKQTPPGKRLIDEVETPLKKKKQSKSKTTNWISF